MSAQHKLHTAALRSVLLAMVAIGLSACTNSSSVGVQQEGALRTGTYPSFGKKPYGETKQLTADEKEQIASNLNNAKARQAGAAAPVSNKSEIEARKRQLQAETEATLKEIEASQ